MESRVKAAKDNTRQQTCDRDPRRPAKGEGQVEAAQGNQGGCRDPSMSLSPPGSLWNVRSETDASQFCFGRPGSHRPRLCKPSAFCAPACSRGAVISTGQVPQRSSSSALPGPIPKAAPFTPKELKGLDFKPGMSHVFVDWVYGFLGITARSPLCLASFIAQSLHRPRACTAYKRAPARDPWPVPPPAPWRRWSGNVSAKPGTRRRRKMRLLSAAYDVLRVLIPTLNWLLLGFPRSPCPECRAGAPLSSEQSSIVDRLLRHVVHFLSTPDFGPESLGTLQRKV